MDLTIVGAVATAIITVIGTVYVARSRTKTDLNASITSGFKELTDQLQEERIQLSEIVRKQKEDLHLNQELVEELERDVRMLRRGIATLEDELLKAGITPPSLALPPKR